MEIENGPRCAMFGAKPLSAPILTYNQDQTSGLLNVKKLFIQEKEFKNIVCKIGGHFDTASMC